MSNNFVPVARGVELLLAEMKEIEAAGPQLKILHRFWKPGTICLPGEEIAMVCLVYRAREFPVRLSLSSRILVDYLARCRLPQTAAEIERAVRRDPFYMRHGANGKPGTQVRMIKRRAVKVFIQRIRQALGAAFQEAGLRLSPHAVVRSESSDTNITLYRIRASIEWVHMQ